MTVVELRTINIGTSHGIFHRLAHSCGTAQAAVHRGDAEPSWVAAAHAPSRPLPRCAALAARSAGALPLPTLVRPGSECRSGPRTDALWERRREVVRVCRGLAAYRSSQRPECRCRRPRPARPPVASQTIQSGMSHWQERASPGMRGPERGGQGDVTWERVLLPAPTTAVPAPGLLSQ